MCSLFGLIDYNKRLTVQQKDRILNTLARECEVRGTDATGIAYNFAGRMQIYKRPLAAHKLKFCVPNGVHVVMGHIRLATQGKPTVIIAKSIKGKGVSFMENNVAWHGSAPNDEQYAQAMDELNAQLKSLEVE